MIFLTEVLAQLSPIFESAYRELRPRAPIPQMHVRFYRFVGLNTTIRLRSGGIYVHLSDLLEAAPLPVLAAIAHILLAKLYRKPIDSGHDGRYHRFVSSTAVSQQAERMRRLRGRKNVSGALGRYYDLEEVFEALNARFFHGLLGRPQLTWSAHQSRRALGHYDAAHNTIVVSRVFDCAETPRFAVEYLVYHEMLHLKHPVQRRGTRRCVHSREFQREEREFPEYAAAISFLKRL